MQFCTRHCTLVLAWARTSLRQASFLATARRHTTALSVAAALESRKLRTCPPRPKQASTVQFSTLATANAHAAPAKAPRQLTLNCSTPAAKGQNPLSANTDLNINTDQSGKALAQWATSASYECAQAGKKRVNAFQQSTQSAGSISPRYHVANKTRAGSALAAMPSSQLKLQGQLHSTHEQDQCGSAGWPKRVRAQQAPMLRGNWCTLARVC